MRRHILLTQRALMRMTLAITMLASVLVGISFSPAPASAASPDFGAMSSEVFGQVNAERAARGLEPLGRLSLADTHATEVANHLNNIGDLDNHALFSANAKSWYLSNGSGIWMAGENMAYNHGTTNEAVVNLMNSAPHRANMLSTGFTHIGIGLACSSSGRLYTVMHFTSDDYAKASASGGSTPAANPVVTDRNQGSTCDSVPSPLAFTDTDCTFYSPAHAPHLGNATTDAVGGQVFRLYVAYFSRVPDLAGFNYWVGQVESGSMTMREISAFFATSPEFQATYGNISNYYYTNLVYQNVLCRNPDEVGYDYWLNALDMQTLDRGEVMLFFSDSPEFKVQTNT